MCIIRTNSTENYTIFTKIDRVVGVGGGPILVLGVDFYIYNGQPTCAKPKN